MICRNCSINLTPVCKKWRDTSDDCRQDITAIQIVSAFNKTKLIIHQYGKNMVMIIQDDQSAIQFVKYSALYVKKLR